MARFNLPDIDFVEITPQEIEEIAVQKFESLHPGATLSEADPRRKMIQAFVYAASIIANNIDYTGKQNRLAFAEDEYLDHIGEERNIPRLEPKPAETTLRFDVTNVVDYVIPANTEVTNGVVTFVSKTDVLAKAADEYVTVEAVCTTEGTEGNGILAGELSTMSNPISWVTKVSNLTVTSGGYDWEENDAYAERIYLSPEGYSTAGPELAYIYHAKSAHQGIVDVQVLSPSAATVAIYPLMSGGELASDDVKAKIIEACNRRDVRPLTDFVIVEDPEVVYYDLTITYYLPEYARSRQSDFDTAIGSAISGYKTWQRSKLGRGIDPGELYSALLKADAKRVTVEPNVFVPLEKNQVARDRDITIEFGGFIDD